MTVFSQKDTKITTTDSIICLPKNVAKEVIKDIIRKDSCQEELNLVILNYELSQKNNIYKDSIIQSKQNEIDLCKLSGKNYETMLTLKDTQKQNLELSIKPLQKELRKSKISLHKTQIGAGAIILGLLYFILK